MRTFLQRFTGFNRVLPCRTIPVLIKKVRYVAILYEDNGGLRPSIMSADKEAARLSFLAAAASTGSGGF
jgi:hypothetical protein